LFANAFSVENPLVSFPGLKNPGLKLANAFGVNTPHSRPQFPEPPFLATPKAFASSSPRLPQPWEYPASTHVEL
jgi:hypothetical protein